MDIDENGGYDDVSARQVEVRFTTKLKPPYRATHTSISIPAGLTRFGLSSIVNNLLRAANEDWESELFDFLIDGELVRMSLEEFLLARTLILNMGNQVFKYQNTILGWRQWAAEEKDQDRGAEPAQEQGEGGDRPQPRPLQSPPTADSASTRRGGPATARPREAARVGDTLLRRGRGATRLGRVRRPWCTLRRGVHRTGTEGSSCNI